MRKFFRVDAIKEYLLNLNLDKIKIYANYALWIIPSVLAPFILLVVISQNSTPGSLLYPYKRGVEMMVLSLASLHPTTKAYVHADLADRRFSEAESMLLASANSGGLDAFVAEVQDAQMAIANISDPLRKKELAEALVKKIDAYEEKLTQVQVKIQESPEIPEPSLESSSENVDNFDDIVEEEIPTAIASPTIAQQNKTSIFSSPTQKVKLPTATPKPTISSRKQKLPTATPKLTLSPTVNQVRPTITHNPSPTMALTPTPTPATGTSGKINDTKDTLDKIKDKLKPNLENFIPVPSVTPIPTIIISPTSIPLPTVPSNSRKKEKDDKSKDNDDKEDENSLDITNTPVKKETKKEKD